MGVVSPAAAPQQQGSISAAAVPAAAATATTAAAVREQHNSCSSSSCCTASGPAQEHGSPSPVPAAAGGAHFQLNNQSAAAAVTVLEVGLVKQSALQCTQQGFSGPANTPCSKSVASHRELAASATVQCGEGLVLTRFAPAAAIPNQQSSSNPRWHICQHCLHCFSVSFVAWQQLSLHRCIGCWCPLGTGCGGKPVMSGQVRQQQQPSWSRTIPMPLTQHHRPCLNANQAGKGGAAGNGSTSACRSAMPGTCSSSVWSPVPGGRSGQHVQYATPQCSHACCYSCC